MKATRAVSGLLAVDRFVAPFAAAKLVVMLTYFAAQNSFYLSALEEPPAAVTRRVAKKSN